MLKYRDFTPEQKLALKHSVMESVKKSGQENLAKYLLDVYHHLEEEQKNKKGKHGRRRKVSVYELDVTSQNKK